MAWIGRVSRASAWALPAVAFTDYVGTVEPVRDESMSPSLRAECSEYVWVDKFWCNRRWVAAAPGGQLDRSLRGQIVYAKSPLVADEYVMKRVVGLPGDWVSVPRPGSSSSTELEDGDWETKSKRVHVGQGQLWVESDNRDHAASSDAEFVSGLVRTISPGFLLHIQPSDADSSTSLSLSPAKIPFGLVQGQVTRVIWPPGRMDRVRDKVDLMRSFPMGPEPDSSA